MLRLIHALCITSPPSSACIAKKAESNSSNPKCTHTGSVISSVAIDLGKTVSSRLCMYRKLQKALVWMWLCRCLKFFLENFMMCIDFTSMHIMDTKIVQMFGLHNPQNVVAFFTSWHLHQSLSKYAHICLVPNFCRSRFTFMEVRLANEIWASK